MSGEKLPQSTEELTSILRPEHELLGATIAPIRDGGVLIPLSYGKQEYEQAAFSDSVALSDLSGVSITLVSKAPASLFAEMSFAGKRLKVGECDFEAVLAGDATLMGIVLLARTGDSEYTCWCADQRAELIFSWLTFLSKIEQADKRPFEGIEVADVSSRLLPLLLAGPDARAILTDYIGDQSLPDPGHSKNLLLDTVVCLVTSLPKTAEPAFLILVPPAFSRIFWRSLLSFPSVQPVGRKAVRNWAGDSFSWLSWIDTPERVIRSSADLLSAGLIRTQGGFIGARGLS